MGKTVVIIDDSMHILTALTKFFKTTLKFTVQATGTDGDQAIMLYRKHRPDLITLDISMPNKTGIEACREILAEFPDAKILMVTAVRGSELADCVRYGAQGCILKPLKFNDSGYVMHFTEMVEKSIAG